MRNTGFNFEEISAPKPHTIQLDSEGDNVLHFVAMPDGQFSLEPVVFPSDPVIQYEFKLDEFQKKSVSCVHRGESVLVSAHTSAGKTVIAKYAIALALKNHSRVVYTSPIKALSNQKYQELRTEFDAQYGEGSVGLMTGDVTINPSASCLVMTTEILRMMLFTGDALIRELSWVIYDEVHYMKDRERGVVWEESIIMLPDAIRFVFLSATIPNAKEFSEWVSKTHNQVCHVVYTEHRPVPLRYYISPLGDPKPYLVRNADGVIVDQTFALACSSVQQNSGSNQTFNSIEVKNSSKNGKPSKKVVAEHTCRIIENLYQNDLFPMIVFVFSRRDCDKLHESLGSRSFVQPEEKEFINQIFNNAIAKLDPEDRELPQIESMRKLVERGIGVHHGGLMPIVKEVVEVLFQYRLIQILFATETFSMGLNMPAKTVVFHSLYKYDGNEQRLISSGEFIQMSGRAGRRNRDKFGAVIVNYTGDPQPSDLRTLMTSAAQPLNSEFRVTYNMLLNLMSTSYLNPKSLMRKSFHQFQMERSLPELISKRDSLIQSAESIVLDNIQLTSRTVELETRLRHCESDMKRIAFCEDNIKMVLKPGSIIKIVEWGYGVVVSPPTKGEVIVIVASVETIDKTVKPYALNPTLRMQPSLIKIGLNDIEAISLAHIDVSFDSLNNALVKKILTSVQKLEKSGIAQRDPLEFVKKDLELYHSLKEESVRIKNMLDQVGSVDRSSVEKYIKRKELLEEAEALGAKIRTMESLTNQKDLDSMCKVLETLSFIDSQGIVQLKGRVAAAINSADEIVTTELLIEGCFNNLTVNECAALLSCFVSESDANEKTDIPDSLSPAWTHLQRIIQHVSTISQECGCEIDVEKFKSGFVSSYMDLTIQWASGIPFSSVMQSYPHLYEGSIIRTMKRLDELVLQMERAATIIGDTQLAEKFKQASSSIRRGIVHTASLYL